MSLRIAIYSITTQLIIFRNWFKLGRKRSCGSFGSFGWTRKVWFSRRSSIESSVATLCSACKLDCQSGKSDGRQENRQKSERSFRESIWRLFEQHVRILKFLQMFYLNSKIQWISFQVLYITFDILPNSLEWQLAWNPIHCSKVGRRWIFDRSQRPQTHQFRDITVNIVIMKKSPHVPIPRLA